jgi:hypothetical protein
MDRKDHLSRRDFLKTAGVLGTGSLLATSTGLQPSAPRAAEAEQQGRQVPTRPFGKSGIQVSCLSLGGMFDIPSNQLVLRQALNWGVSYWDTADCYNGGKSELGIGQFFAKNPEARAKVFLVTKSDARDPEGISALLQRSLERMKTDHIDLYLLHAVRSPRELTPEVRAWAEKAKADGKIKLFGFSSHSNMEDCLEAAAKSGWIDGIMMTYNFRLMHSDEMKAAVEACVKAGVGLTAMKTQGGGSVSTESETEIEMAGRFLSQGYTDKQARLKAVWENPQIASICSQMPNLTILMSNVAAALNQTKLSRDSLQLLDRYAEDTCDAYCAGCTRFCEPEVAGRVPVADVMRYLMYYGFYGERDLARELFAAIALETREALRRIDYSAAEARCPRRLPIARLMEEAVVKLG